MRKFPSYRQFLRQLSILVGAYFAFCSFGIGQVLNQDQQVEVHNLPSLMSKSKDSTEVLLTSLDTIIHDRDICCGKDSALADSAEAADAESLKDVAAKLDGRHLLSDGRPVKVKATYLPPDAINPDLIVKIANQHAALLQWDSHVYVVYGVVYMWQSDHNPENGGNVSPVIHKLLLWDVRYSDARRSVIFNRDTDDVSKLQGMLMVEARLQ